MPTLETFPPTCYINQMSIPVPRKQQLLKEPLSKPPWLKVKAPGSPDYLQTKRIVKDLKLNTVCEEAACPNIGECWSRHTATFIILGEYCTRHCHFCAVKKGNQETLQAPDPLEPQKIAQAIKKLKLKHAVITSVDRDDLEDFGAGHFAATITAINKLAPTCSIEILIPDFQGSPECLQSVMKMPPNILNHNIETVPSLYKKVRPYAGYIRSLSVLRLAKEMAPSVMTKSGIMVGLGEKTSEVLRVMDDLRESNVDIMTIGQYLRPTSKQVPVQEFITPDEFKNYKEEALTRGFRFVESAPLVRSSYHAWKHSLIRMAQAL